MKLSAHPERRTAFDQRAAALGLIHGTCAPHSPWQNGIVERSHRTDNEELFHRLQFANSEERRYLLRLWEQEYNCRRPHQGLGGRTPLEVYRELYPVHAATRMLT
jgi:transposase InsO family protein